MKYTAPGVGADWAGDSDSGGVAIRPAIPQQTKAATPSVQAQATLQPQQDNDAMKEMQAEIARLKVRTSIESPLATYCDQRSLSYA